MTSAPLAGRDARILHLLVQVCRIGTHDRAWTTADVRRVATQHLRPALLASTTPPQPQPRQTKPRRARATYPQPDSHRTVALTPRQTQVLDHMRAGHTPDQTAADLHVTPGRAANVMSEVTRACGAIDRHHALALIASGAVTVQPSERKNR